MAGIVIDELITKLEYESNDAVLKQAAIAVQQLGEENKAAAVSADKLSAENRKLAEQTDALTHAQLELADQLAATSNKTQQLTAEQRDLKAQIKQAGSATDEQSARLAELDRELRQTADHSRELREESARLGREKQRVSGESRKVARAQSDVAKTSRTAAAAQRQLKDAMRGAADKARDESGAMAKLATHIKGVAGGALAADVLRAVGAAVVDLGKNIIETGANFESLRARLKTVEGSSEGAAAAFGMITDFAKKTPFEVDNITEAFTALRVRGVNPTTDTLTALGDLSSAFGLQFKDTTDAIGAAARGELDPIEKLGITAKIAGDKISLTFKGQTEMVDRSADAVTNALVKFGQMEGVQGAMAEQSMTTAGMFSNLKDTVAALFDQIAQMGVLDEVKLLIESLSGAMGEEGLGQVIADVLIIALRTLRELLEGMPAGALIEFLQALVTAAGVLAEVLVDVAGEGQGMTGAMAEIATTVIETVTAVYGLLQRFDELGESLGGMPGPLDLLLKAIELLLIPFNAFADLVTRIIDQVIDPFLDKIEVWTDRFQGLSAVFDPISSGIESVATRIGIMNAELEATTSIANAATNALAGLYGAKPTTEEERKKKAAQDNALAAEADAKFQANRKAPSAKAEKLLEKPEDLSSEQLAAMAADPNISEKARTKASKEIEKRSKKRGKGKGAKTPEEHFLTQEIEKQIAQLGEEAGRRAAARAQLNAQQRGKPLTDAERNKIEMDERTAVQGRLTNNFQSTGQLPPGLAMDLVQAAALPNLEETGGRLAPPVITVNNTRVEVTGNTFEANITVEGGINGTPAQVASAVTTQAQSVTFQGLGRTIQNQLTNER